MMTKNLKDCPEFISEDHCGLRELVNPHHDPGFPGRYSLAYATVEPGKKSFAHKMLTSEAYYILEGHAIIHIDNEQAQIGPEDFVSIPPGATQWIENTGTTHLVFLCIVDPAWRKEDEIVD